MCEICGITEDMLAGIYESYEKVGCVKEDLAKELGLTDHVAVAAGAGDNAAAAVGTGTRGEGRCNISLGTSGTIFISSKNFRVDSASRICTRRRHIPSDGLHVKCSIMQQVVDGRNSSDKRVCKRAG